METTTIVEGLIAQELEFRRSELDRCGHELATAERSLAFLRERHDGLAAYIKRLESEISRATFAE